MKEPQKHSLSEPAHHISLKRRSIIFCLHFSCPGSQPGRVSELWRDPGVPHEGGGQARGGSRGRHHHGQPRHRHRGLRGLHCPPHCRGHARILQVRGCCVLVRDGAMSRRICSTVAIPNWALTSFSVHLDSEYRHLNGITLTGYWRFSSGPAANITFRIFNWEFFCISFVCCKGRGMKMPLPSESGRDGQTGNEISNGTGSCCWCSTASVPFTCYIIAHKRL